MDGTLTGTGFAIAARALGRAMPMHLCLDAAGIIVGAGPTLGKIAPQPLLGQPFLAMFDLRRPGSVASMAELAQHHGQRLHLALRAAPETGLRGIALPLEGGGTLVNLSFGIDLPAAVRQHRLSDSDFAPTEHAIELLSLIEVMHLVLAELRDLNHRLQGAKSRAEEEAQTDTLTGLRNRRALDARLRALIETGEPFGMMHIDLDYFKQVNDSLGHAAGDHVLQEVARVLTSTTRKFDIVARIGGDEFVVLLPGLVDMPRLDSVAQRIIQRLSQPIMFDGRACRISASIGTTVSTLYAAPDPETLLADADRALYASKHAGRSRATLHRPPGQEAEPQV